MANRTALLISCSRQDAEMIRARARREHHSVSGYMLHILVRAVRFEELIFSQVNRLARLNGRASQRFVPALEIKTKILLRCSAEEAERIRTAAKRRDASISKFVMHCLSRSWNVENTPPQDLHA
ncbi:MAG: hypothetical protein WBQ59_05185 [Candidatus Acidiferrum sp.]